MPKEKDAQGTSTWAPKLVWSSLLAPMRMSGGAPVISLRLSRVLKKKRFLDDVPAQSGHRSCPDLSGEVIFAY